MYGVEGEVEDEEAKLSSKEARQGAESRLAYLASSRIS